MRLFLASTPPMQDSDRRHVRPAGDQLERQHSHLHHRGRAVAIASGAAITSRDSPTLVSLTATIENLSDGSAEQLQADTSGTPITASYANGTLTLAGTADVATYQAVLQSITYSDTASSANLADRTIRSRSTTAPPIRRGDHHRGARARFDPQRLHDCRRREHVQRHDGHLGGLHLRRCRGGRYVFLYGQQFRRRDGRDRQRQRHFGHAKRHRHQRRVVTRRHAHLQRDPDQYGGQRRRSGHGHGDARPDRPQRLYDHPGRADLQRHHARRRRASPLPAPRRAIRMPTPSAVPAAERR